MSLFDIIKYQNTDLDNYDALMELPEDLVILFWVKAHEATNAVPTRNDKNKMCAALSIWSNRLDDNDRSELKNETFNKALKEYSNVNL